MMPKFYIILFCLFNSLLAQSQGSAEEYGLKIYDLIMTGNAALTDEFVDLNQYTSYIDRLEKLPQEEKEAIKADASKSYTEVKQNFNAECQKIVKLYSLNSRAGSTFEFTNCTFTQSKNFPDIGFVTCYYVANIPVEEEPLEDAFVFECLKTENGWRILDGFFDAPEIN